MKTILAPKRHLYAIGDIHGCLNELKRLIEKIDFDASLDQMIFMGDYVDRGLDSKGVIDYLIDFKKKAHKTIFLKGNHEDMMLDYLGLGGMHGRYWLQNGGDLTIESYVSAYKRKHITKEQIARDHLSFLLSLDLCVECSSYLFVHAGLNPFDSLDQQETENLLWIREPFLNNPSPFGERVIVHGHTPFKHAHIDKEGKKIGIDTGCVFGGELTCIECNTQTITTVKSEYEY